MCAAENTSFCAVSQLDADRTLTNGRFDLLFRCISHGNERPKHQRKRGFPIRLFFFLSVLCHKQLFFSEKSPASAEGRGRSPLVMYTSSAARPARPRRDLSTPPFPPVITNSGEMTSSSGLPGPVLRFPSERHRSGVCACVCTTVIVPFGNAGRQMSFRTGTQGCLKSTSSLCITFVSHTWTVKPCFFLGRGGNISIPLYVVPQLCKIHMTWIQQYVRQAVRVSSFTLHKTRNPPSNPA